MRRLLQKQVIRFFRYQRVSECCKKMSERKRFYRKHPNWFNDYYGRHAKEQLNKDYIKMCKRRQKLYREWRKVTDESIKDFPYIHKEELMKSYKNYNPFEKYYKDDKEDE